MNWFVTHVASGQVFFSGGILLLIAMFAKRRTKRKLTRRLLNGAIGFAILLIAISSTPLHPATWLLLAGVTFQCLRNESVSFAKLATAWFIVMAYESTWHWIPTVTLNANQSIVVLADSVTSGLGEGEATTWPEMLRRKTTNPIIDLSHVGETVRSGHKRAKQHELPSASVVFVELGGNDILGSTSRSEFEHDLNELLSWLSADGQTIVLFELPLPPLCNAWGRAQRLAAKRYGAHLIPKHAFAAVFEGRKSTLDSIHLSQLGHDRMLQLVETVIAND